MSHNNDNDGAIYFGGAVAGVILIGFLIKVLKSILDELTLVFTSFGKTVSAFIPMALNIALVMGLIALGVFAIYCAWIFSKKYYQLVKDGTHVKEQIESRFSDLRFELTESIEELKRDSVRDIFQMRKELRAALKRADVTPGQSTVSTTNSVKTELTTAPVAHLPNAADNQLVHETTDANVHSSGLNQTDQAKTQVQDAPKDIVNPF